MSFSFDESLRRQIFVMLMPGANAAGIETANACRYSTEFECMDDAIADAFIFADRAASIYCAKLAQNEANAGGGA